MSHLVFVFIFAAPAPLPAAVAAVVVVFVARERVTHFAVRGGVAKQLVFVLAFA